MIIADFQRYKNGENGILAKASASDRGFSKRLIFCDLVGFGGGYLKKRTFCAPIRENRKKISDCREIFVACQKTLFYLLIIK